jgi:hypothetical protein
VKRAARDPQPTKRRVSEGKSEAIIPKTDFRSWIGIAAKGPANPNPRFKSEDDLWKKDGD